MDWTYAIERNRDALKRVLAALVAMAGLAEVSALTSPLWGRGAAAAGRPGAMEMAPGETSARSHAEGDAREASGGGENLPTTPTRHSDECRPPHKGEVESVIRPTLPRHLHRAVLRLLRPAEAAARRLVIMAARGLVVAPPRQRPRKPPPERPSKGGRPGAVTGIWMPPHLRSSAARPPRRAQKRALPLFDPLPRMLGPKRVAANGCRGSVSRTPTCRSPCRPGVCPRAAGPAGPTTRSTPPDWSCESKRWRQRSTTCRPRPGASRAGGRGGRPGRLGRARGKGKPPAPPERAAFGRSSLAAPRAPVEGPSTPFTTSCTTPTLWPSSAGAIRHVLTRAATTRAR
jgi:hypothetical protein